MIKYIHPVSPKDAEGLVEVIYSQIKQDFGRIVEPFRLHSQLPELLAGAWMACRETELVGKVPRKIKEAVATVVSNQNQCPYCVDAHTIMLKASNEKQLAKAIRTKNFNQIKDVKTLATVEWVLSGLGTPPPFNQSEAPEIIGTVVYFNYINRMANVFLGKTPLPSNQPILKPGLLQIAPILFSSSVKCPKIVGDSLQFLPNTELPADLVWAKNAGNVAGAFARFAKIVEINGAYALPEEVRSYVEKQISEINMIRTQNNTAQTIQFNNKALNSAAKITLLTAISPYKVDDKTIVDFRKHYPEDTKLLGALSWASFTAARKIGKLISK